MDALPAAKPTSPGTSSLWVRGDRAALAAQVERVLPLVWALVRGGFIRTAEPRVQVLGVRDGDRAERLAAEIVAAALTPEARGTHGPDAPSWRTQLLVHAAHTLETYAREHGGEVTLRPDAELPERPDLGRPDFVVDAVAAPLDVDDRARAVTLAELARALDLDAADHAIVERRWQGEEPREIVGAALGISPRRVEARERVIRRHLRHQAAAHGLTSGVALADLDVALAGETAAHRLLRPIRERITASVLSRVEPEAPRPTAVRVAWAVGTLALGLALGAAMYFDVLPSPHDDAQLTPAVTLSCDGPCTPGAIAHATVAAPRKARRVAVSVLDAAGVPVAWLADPQGRSVPLPARARLAATALTGRLVLPADRGELRAVAVFSKRRLDRHELERAATGEAPEGAHAAWSTVTVE